jgi:hypothetical protein
MPLRHYFHFTLPLIDTISHYAAIDIIIIDD